jgi:hypothetical protein
MAAMPVAGPMTAQEEVSAQPEQEHRCAELVGGEIAADGPSPLPLPLGFALNLDAVSAQ